MIIRYCFCNKNSQPFIFFYKLLHSVDIFVRLIFLKLLFPCSEMTSDFIVCLEPTFLSDWHVVCTLIWSDFSCPTFLCCLLNVPHPSWLRVLPTFASSEWISDLMTPSHLGFSPGTSALVQGWAVLFFELCCCLLVIFVFLPHCIMLYSYFFGSCFSCLYWILNSWNLGNAFYYYIFLEVSKLGNLEGRKVELFIVTGRFKTT